MNYHISAWHNNAIEGTHQFKILSAKSIKQALLLFAKELQKPAHMRAFTNKNKVFLWSNQLGHIMDLPVIEEITL